MIARADAARLPLADQSVDLVVGSPPYMDARLYLEGGANLRISRRYDQWVGWMLRVTAECLRVSRGPVIWVWQGVTKGRCYRPGPEAVMVRWFEAGGHCHRPDIWRKNGQAGSGGDQGFRCDHEYATLFKRPGKLPYADPLATGKPPKLPPGGRTTMRDRSGKRRRRETDYVPPAIANPGSTFYCPVGGGRLGHKHAHDGEAPYPVRVPARYILTYCPPGGIVLDPFGGSGTTAHAAKELGRRWLSFDLRQSQCELTRKRLASVQPMLRAFA